MLHASYYISVQNYVALPYPSSHQFFLVYFPRSLSDVNLTVWLWKKKLLNKHLRPPVWSVTPSRVLLIPSKILNQLIPPPPTPQTVSIRFVPSRAGVVFFYHGKIRVVVGVYFPPSCLPKRLGKSFPSFGGIAWWRDVMFSAGNGYQRRCQRIRCSKERLLVFVYLRSAAHYCTFVDCLECI